MAYKKQTWNTGDVITEGKLNHMEDGIASGGMFVVGSTDDESTQIVTLDKTYKEIVDAFNAGQNVVLKRPDGHGTTHIDPLVSYGSIFDSFVVSFFNFSDQMIGSFLTDSENGYPSKENGGSD